MEIIKSIQWLEFALRGPKKQSHKTGARRAQMPQTKLNDAGVTCKLQTNSFWRIREHTFRYDYAGLSSEKSLNNILGISFFGPSYFFKMVGVAQLVEPRIVIPVVVGSIPIVHPSLRASQNLENLR